MIFLDKSRNLSKIVSVLLSASVERFFVSRMRDFFFYRSSKVVQPHTYYSERGCQAPNKLNFYPQPFQAWRSITVIKENTKTKCWRHLLSEQAPTIMFYKIKIKNLQNLGLYTNDDQMDPLGFFYLNLIIIGCLKWQHGTPFYHRFWP